ncbi:hypothetical protein KEJ45_01840, partial [Candidatus Bathyarchaeota archaeon]|nr:hypothetical protein [Candidatus Bathyarchaeota archaeon]
KRDLKKAEFPSELWEEWDGVIRKENFNKCELTVLHLRNPTDPPGRQFLSGYVRAKTNYSFIKTLAHAILLRRPHVLRGYLYGKKH